MEACYLPSRFRAQPEMLPGDTYYLCKVDTYSDPRPTRGLLHCLTLDKVHLSKVLKYCTYLGY